jgi:hypothetical protein
VSLSSVKRYARVASVRKSLALKKKSGSYPKLDERARRLLAADVEQRRFLTTLCEGRDYLKVVGGVSVGNPRVCGELGWMERTRKRTGKKGA